MTEPAAGDLQGELLVVKSQTIESLGQLDSLATTVGIDTLAEDLTKLRIPKLEEERFILVVLGEFNHGTSPFVNALCGQAILPAGITPTTATLNHLVHAPAPYAKAHLFDDTVVDVEVKQIADWVTVEGKQAERVHYLEIGWPADILKHRLTIVDTPGVNDINEQRAEITYGYVPRADAVLFLLDATQVLKQSERTFLEQRILKRSKDKLIFVLGKIDLLAPDEREEALRYAREHLSAILPEPHIFPLSAKRALSKNEADRQSAGLDHLVKYLDDFLVRERGRVLLDNAIGDGQRVAAYLRQNLGIKRRSLDLAIDELEIRIDRVRSQLANAHANLKSHHQKIAAETQAIKAGVRLDLEGFVEEVKRRLPDEIEHADADDVKKFLQPFLEDIWKHWAEQEGDKIAGQLERLAEEIIQITNENVGEAMDTLAREFGTADTKIELNVDTLKYDVGVFALGALGTGIFLFVNTLVGGVLTLAAPILAVIFKERIASEVKAQAKKSLPEVIDRAAHAIGPRFEAIIDDFQAKLDDFVSAAGDALYRGIGEILDKALAERRSAGESTEQQIARLSGELDTLTGIEQSLNGQRERLWASSTDSTSSPPISAT